MRPPKPDANDPEDIAARGCGHSLHASVDSAQNSQRENDLPAQAVEAASAETHGADQSHQEAKPITVFDAAAEAKPGDGTEACLDYLALEGDERKYVELDLAEGTQIDERGPKEVVVTVRGGVKMRSWLILGGVVGVILAVVLTYIFPEQREFTRGQVLGFLLVFVTALMVVVFAAIAGLIDVICSRRRSRVVLRRKD